MGSKWFSTSFSALVILAVFWGASVYMCSPSVVEKTVSANELARAYAEDPETAAGLYGGVIVQVDGIVHGVEGTPHPTTIILRADDSVGHQMVLIECRLQQRARKQSRAVVPYSRAVFAGKIVEHPPADRVILDNCLLLEFY